MTVYLDLYFIINFTLNYIILYITKKIIGCNSKLLVGTLFATACSFLYLFYDYFILKVIFALTITLVTFGKNKITYVRSLITFLIVSFCVGGCCYSVFGILNYNSKKFLILLTVCTLFCFSILNVFSMFYTKLAIKNKDKTKVVIEHNKCSVKIYGIVDTGNCLYDPYFNLPVIVVNEDAVKQFINIKTFLVPFNSVGNSDGLLPCFMPEKVTVNGKEVRCVIGISKTKLTADGTICALINPSTILTEV